jgi:hypothetical protein
MEDEQVYLGVACVIAIGIFAVLFLLLVKL